MVLMALPVKAADWAPPDRELWDAMARALSDLPMSLNTHQQVQRILADVQRESQIRATRAKEVPKP